MSFAFGDPPDSGVIASANADGAAIRIARAAAKKAARSRRLGMPWGKAAGSYLRFGQGIYFVPVAPSGAWGISPAGPAGPRRRGRPAPLKGPRPPRARAPAAGPPRAPRCEAA